jgi:hypothetical protein
VQRKPYVNSRQLGAAAFKRLKRKQFREAHQALGLLQNGCSYLPREAFLELTAAIRRFEAALELCRDWWRKT